MEASGHSGKVERGKGTGPGGLAAACQPAQCEAPASPRRNGLPVRADGRRVHQSPDGTLLIRNLGAGDEGSYTCSAYRGNQTASRSTQVKVAPPGEQGCGFVLPLGASEDCRAGDQ